MWKIILALESPVTLDERFKVTPVPFFIPGFHQLICELDSSKIKVL